MRIEPIVSFGKRSMIEHFEMSMNELSQSVDALLGMLQMGPSCVHGNVNHTPINSYFNHS
jgi:hypothetical protein